MYATLPHPAVSYQSPAGGQPPVPQSSGPGIVSPYRPPNAAPNLGAPNLPATVPQTAYPLASVLPSGVGPRSVTPPPLGNPPK